MPPKLPEVDPSSLDRLLPDMAGPIPGSGDERDGLFSLRMFSFRGKPYVLGRGTSTSGSVYSLWNRQPRTWCDFNLLPQREAEVYYPVETWPATQVNR